MCHVELLSYLLCSFVSCLCSSLALPTFCHSFSLASIPATEISDAVIISCCTRNLRQQTIGCCPLRYCVLQIARNSLANHPPPAQPQRAADRGGPGGGEQWSRVEAANAKIRVRRPQATTTTKATRTTRATNF